MIAEDQIGFTWPEVNGALSGLYFYGAMLTDDMTAIRGEMDMVTFGFEP